MAHIRAMFRNTDGVSAVEAALALPVMAIFISILMQFGVAFYAQAGMYHATGQAARYATLYPTPSNQQIRDMLENSEYGLDPARISTLSVTPGVDNGRNFVEIRMDYTVPVVSIWPTGPDITLSETRRSYTY